MYVPVHETNFTLYICISFIRNQANIFKTEAAIKAILIDSQFYIVCYVIKC